MVSKYDRLSRAVLLDELLECNAACSSNFKVTKHKYEEDVLDWLYHNLPNLKYVVDQIVDFIFSNGLTTGDEDLDEKILEPFIYKENRRGTTNYNILREAVRQSIVFGKAGVRFLSLEDGLLEVESKQYAALTAKNEEYYGFEDIVGYILAGEGQKIFDTDIKGLDFDKETFLKKGVIVDKQRQIVIVSKEEFVNLRTDTTKIGGESYLKYDQLRSQMLKVLYERLLYDVEYDGPGRILFELDETYAKGDDNEISTGEVLDKSIKGKMSQKEKVKQEVAALAALIKESGSDQMIAVPPVFKKFTQLPRITKATEFINWLAENEGLIMSHIFGIQPTLIGLGKVSGNVSMEKLIDNAMVNSIVPKRENFAIQISNMLAPKLGVEKIYFDKYEMQQAEDENKKRSEIVNMIEKLVRAGYNGLADKMAKILEADLDENDRVSNKLKSVPKRILEKFLNLFDRREKDE
ncbi:hypothetical protein NRIC_03820 [Enterococcus florum]|uniref:Phage portal protein n=1 Tax=Enterococcus florum TaxID=2480627 RepID=A0A4P5P8E7_9ENTE|nr:hypothetical protein [Enterococcus florum]GCF92491.1 hypothetical protein NRIC_03820 [Enterococcus florum]